MHKHICNLLFSLWVRPRPKEIFLEKALQSTECWTEHFFHARFSLCRTNSVRAPKAMQIINIFNIFNSQLYAY